MIKSLVRGLLKQRVKIYFVYAPEHRASGSTVMRGFQLADIAKRNLGRGYSIKVVPHTKSMSNSIAVFTKGAIYSCSPNRLRELSSKNNQIIFDPVDGVIDGEKLQHASAVIAASKAALEKYKNIYSDKKVFLINHHVDPRITAQPVKKINEPRAAYFGEFVNTIMTEDIEKQVDFFHTDTSSQANMEWIDKVADYNIHYAVRKNVEPGSIKPATKVFTAAYCGANVIIQDAEAEAVTWLGKDYPYLIKGKATERKILDMLASAKSSYGSKEWARGLKTMQKIKNLITEKAIADQVLTMVEGVRDAKGSA